MYMLRIAKDFQETCVIVMQGKAEVRWRFGLRDIAKTVIDELSCKSLVVYSITKKVNMSSSSSRSNQAV